MAIKYTTAEKLMWLVSEHHGLLKGNALAPNCRCLCCRGYELTFYGEDDMGWDDDLSRLVEKACEYSRREYPSIKLPWDD